MILWFPRSVSGMIFGLVAAFAGASARSAPVDFIRDIEPIFKTRCVECHGPAKQKGGLRLDRWADALKGGDDGAAIVAGASATSPLFLNVSRADGAAPMPPKGPALSAAEVDLIRDWIDQGAVWPEDGAAMPAGAGAAPPTSPMPAGATLPAPAEKTPTHWSFAPLVRPPVPEPRFPPDADKPMWAKTPIDRFILARLEAEGLAPAPEADRATLIRRLAFDLTGLPPRPAEVEAFLHDSRPDAYERLVDRLLDSPRYGERWARHWLDAVHFGETHGFDKDKRRDNAWPYRDWVIGAFNANLPYPDFIRSQIAGDVLHPDDPAAVAATGFLAAGPWDFVGNVELREGTMEKERVRALDRDDVVTTVGAAFLSVTVQCARCHNHKFDPITQNDYYAMQAIFAGIDRADRSVEDPALGALRKDLSARRRAAAFRGAMLEDAAAAAPRPAELARRDEAVADLERKLAAVAGAKGESPNNGWHSAESPKADAVKWVAVDLGRAAEIDEIALVPARPTDFADTPGFGFPVRFRVETSLDSEFADARLVADFTAADYANPGDAAVRFDLRPPATARFIRVTATRLWNRGDVYVFALAEVEAIGGGALLSHGAVATSLDSIEAGRWSARFLTDGFDSRAARPVRAGGEGPDERAKLESALAEARRDRDLLAGQLLDSPARAALARARRDWDELSKKLDALPAPSMVYAAVSRRPRVVRVLQRGDVSTPGDVARPGALGLVRELDPTLGFSAPEAKPDPLNGDNDEADNEGARRAALAEWIADPRNPLTYRSIVNRVWHWRFGRGLVETLNDFGHNGAPPSHPELLDWLAAEFRDSGGDMKALQRMISLSAVYRQSASPEPGAARAAEATDSGNRLLWRANRRRLEAEAIRDAALAAGGNLVLAMGGPSFDLFRFKDDHSPRYDYELVDEPRAWRRSVYRFITRSVPDPFFAALDCADPNIQMGARNETQGPLQALALYNDAFMLAQARRFAARLDAACGTMEQKVDLAFRIALGRPAGPDEAARAAAYANEHGLPALCRVIFNLNEFVYVD